MHGKKKRREKDNKTLEERLLASWKYRVKVEQSLRIVQAQWISAIVLMVHKFVL